MQWAIMTASMRDFARCRRAVQTSSFFRYYIATVYSKLARLLKTHSARHDHTNTKQQGHHTDQLPGTIIKDTSILTRRTTTIPMLKTIKDRQNKCLRTVKCRQQRHVMVLIVCVTCIHCKQKIPYGFGHRTMLEHALFRVRAR
jgi:hypothetical protein